MEEYRRENSRQQRKFNIDNANFSQSNNYQPQQEYDYREQASTDGSTRSYGNMQPSVNSDGGAFKKRIKRGAWILGAVAIASVIIYASLFSSASVETGDDAAAALETHMSTTLGAGVRLLEKDENMIGQDYTISHSSSDENTTIWVWDYAAEDGDYVQILVDGSPIGEPFMIKNKAVSFTVPTVAEVQVVGTRDGGGGITYGVYYELNQTTYFNGMDEGGSNTYTLVRE